MTRRARILIPLAFLALRLPFLPPALDDIDAMNFALGLHRFDLAQHQPHPFGYPLYILVGRLARAIVSSDAHALAFWSALFGALLAWPLYLLFRRLDDEPAARLGTLLAMVAPAIWFAGARPMSDVPGFFWTAAALAVMIGTLPGAAERSDQAPETTEQPRRRTEDEKRQTEHPGPTTNRPGRALAAGAALAAAALGFRTQSALITLPVLMLALARHRRGLKPAAMLGIAAAFTGVVLAWAIPLVAICGGPRAYLDAFSVQAAEQTQLVLLVNHFGVRAAVDAVLGAFVQPWGSVPLAVIMLVLAAVGLVSLFRRRPASALALGCAFGPYVVFHLLWQETGSPRYAIPYVAALAFLAGVGLYALVSRPSSVPAVVGPRRVRAGGPVATSSSQRRWVFSAAGGAIVGACAAVTVPALVEYAREPLPAFRALARIPSGAVRTGHFEFARPFKVGGLASSSGYLAPVPNFEWLNVVRFWIAQTGEGRLPSPVYFAADPLRTDLALIDPAARRVVGDWPLSPALDGVVPDARPHDARLVRMDRPQWACREGWSLTPETAGIAAAGAPVDPVADLWPRDADMLLWIGGRHLGRDPGPIHVRVEIGAAALDEFDLARGFFLKEYVLPRERWAGLPNGHTALRVIGRAEGPGSPPPGARRFAVEQFDFQPLTRVSFAFGEGWNELEYDTRGRRLLRWSSDRSVIRVHNPGRSLTLRATGFTPLQYWSSAPSHVSLSLGGVTLGMKTITSRDFAVEWPLPASAFAGATVSDLILSTDHTFVPDRVQHNGDQRTLGLKIYTLTIQ